MSGIPLRLIEQWLGEAGHLVEPPIAIGAPVAQSVREACVDSRVARAGCLFVALPGARTDGHEFVDQACRGGAVAALVSQVKLAAVRPRLYGSVRLFPVDDPLAALQSLSFRWRRRHQSLHRVGVTGSNGKTTVKELIGSILARSAPTVISRGNLNSDIGLPMELLRIRPDHRYGVFEMGMNRIGEIGLLAQLTEPDTAVITNIGTAHIGMVGSQDAIAQEKRAVFSAFTGRQTAVIPDADQYADYLADGVAGSVVRYGMHSARVQSVDDLGLDGFELHADEGPIRLSIPGRPMISNALAAITVARSLDVRFQDIRDGLESVRASFGRSEVIRSRVTIIQDCYNANPESMRAALDVLAATTSGGRRVAVLGSMKELGAESGRRHAEIASYASSLGIDRVILYGDEFADAVDASVVRVFPDDQWESVVDELGFVREGDTILLKGSRAVELERLTPLLTEAR
ncbi:MAG: UDP-N-acetylmuramoyl-tripeptide--D-alanyl-D-alanine ligase [Spirochaetaceae bacterium]|nr:MAG: UDP-N-acetylmuramoyl-tripeptide--D-alanyl-D-alanine ligase [Spirochaetaceae bacterium]